MSNKINIDPYESSPEEVRHAAKAFLGLTDVTADTPISQVRERVAKALGHAKRQAAIEGGSGELRPGYVRISIAKTADPSGKNWPVPVIVNGYPYQVPRGIELDVPGEVAEALRNAIETHHEQNEEGGEWYSHNAPSYPMTIIRGDVDEALAVREREPTVQRRMNRIPAHLLKGGKKKAAGKAAAG